MQKKYAYVYSSEMCNGKNHILSIQLTICNYIKNLFDPIELREITNDIINKYDVICVDGFVLPELRIPHEKAHRYLDIIRNCKNICVLTRDLHEHTFDGRCVPTVTKDMINGIYVPKKGIDRGYIQCKARLEKYNVKNIISIYDCNEFDNLINFTKCNPYILSLHVDTKIFKNLNIKRDIDVLVYGADYYPIYPLRNNVKRVVKKMNIKHHVMDPCPYYDPNKCNNGLANLLNRSWLTLCTCSVYDYLVLKYFEASACGSVVVGNMAKQGKEIWEDNYINIPNNATDNEIMQIITMALENKERLTQIGEKMCQKISSEYNYDQYAIKLKAICDDINKNNL